MLALVWQSLTSGALCRWWLAGCTSLRARAPPTAPPTAPTPGRRLYTVLMRRRGASAGMQRLGVALWLFSPFTVAISTRGNGEALVTLMLLGLLLALDAGAARVLGCLLLALL